jgi:hypothetical protein
MNDKSIMREACELSCTKPYPTEDIKKEAARLSARIQDKYKQLRYTVFMNTDMVRSRWMEKNQSDRKAALKKAWANIPTSHRPEVFGEKGSVLQPGQLPRDREMLPYLNLEDLAEKDSLLMLVGSRARHPPHALALTELDFAPLGEVEPAAGNGPLRDPLLKMQLSQPHNYGSLVSFRSAAEADDFVGEAKGLSPVAGLQVLYMQDRLLAFLLNVIIPILRKEELKAIDYSKDLAQPELLVGQDSEILTTSIFDIAKKEPYHPPKDLQLDRLLLMVSAECQRAHDRVWDIREDPRFFEALYNTTVQNSSDLIPDAHGRAHPITKESSPDHAQYVAWVLQDMVVRSHYSLVQWDHLEGLIKTIQALFEAHPDGINVRDLTPKDLVEAIQKLQILLAQLQSRAAEQVRLFMASPDLRTQFDRVPAWLGSSTKIQHSAAYFNNRESLQANLCDFLTVICGRDLNCDNPMPPPDVRYRLDMLETFLQKASNAKARKYITSPVNDALNKLWILSECQHRLSRQPWYLKVSAIFLDPDKLAALVDPASDPAAAWIKIFTEGREEGFVTSPELGKPGPQFYYNVKATESREKNVKMLCAAEVNLDKFWNHVDTNLNKLANNYQQGVIQRLLTERGNMHRTIPWDKRDHSKKMVSSSLKGVYDHEFHPLSHTFHDSSLQITG